MALIYCKECGAQISENAPTCPKCGSVNSVSHNSETSGERKSKTTALLLCIFLGVLGIHSFYCNKTKNGVLQLLTGGGCGVWTLIDIISIITGRYRDSNNMPLV